MRLSLFSRLLARGGNTPRWIVFSFDTAIVLFSLVLAYLLRFNFRIPETELHSWRHVFPAVLAVRMASFYLFKTYAGIVRYTSTRDAVRVSLSLAAGSALFCAVNAAGYAYGRIFPIPFSIVVLEYIVTAFLMTGGRLGVKILYSEIRIPTRDKTKVIIYGAGESGVITKRAIDRDAGTKYKVSAFVDDNPKKAGKRLEGILIYDARTQLEGLLRNNDVRHLIISIQNISPARKKQLIESCLAFNTKVLNVPPVNTWINGELSFKQIQKIHIEDLLDRDPIRLDTERIKRELAGKKILITGAAGSIGSELVRQVIPFHPDAVFMLDIAESPLHELELEMADHHKLCHTEAVMGDVRNAERLRNVFSTFRPDIVFHAAAYKHVPMMENNPSESILTNVLGTKTVADLAHEFKLKKFVLVSTDKAVNPTSVMGATKRIAEIYVQSLNRQSPCSFVTTRFGNVLGSNGSVIPRFHRQIEQRKPVSVTHPDVTRYFMTIPEACQLVLEAGAMGSGGEIYIFDMGKPVRIDDLARKMIQLSGLTLGKDIQIVYTGLRPGEKLYEELLANEENTIQTHHPKIMVARVKEYDFTHIASEIRELIALFDTQNNDAIVRKMKRIVPEFISRNSVFEKLDTDAPGEAALRTS